MLHPLLSSLSRRLLWAVALAAGSQAYADCFPSSPTQTVSFPERGIWADISEGRVIETVQVSYTIRCNRDGLTTAEGSWLIYLAPNNVSAGGPIGGYSGVVPTGVPGIGLRWTNTTSSVGDKVMTTKALNDSSQNRGIPASDGFGTTTSIKDTFELIKTGPITVGMQSITLNDIVIWRQSALATQKPFGELYRFKFPSFKLTNASCTLDQKNLSVNMGRVNRGRFSGVNSTAGNVPFTIDLTCIPGVSIHMTYGAANAVPGVPGTIKLSNDSSAAGAGIQVLNQGSNTPITFGEPIELGIKIKPRVSIPLSARYIQTAPVLTPGTANGTMTFTVSYY